MLEKQADKIQDENFRLLSVKIQEGASYVPAEVGLPKCHILFASLAIVPFTITGSVFSIDFILAGPPKHLAPFVICNGNYFYRSCS
jgi:hypothetical protein